jgi:hypothetical protein
MVIRRGTVAEEVARGCYFMPSVLVVLDMLWPPDMLVVLVVLAAVRLPVGPIIAIIMVGNPGIPIEWCTCRPEVG